MQTLAGNPRSFTATWVRPSGGSVKIFRELLVGSDPTGEEERALRGPYVKPIGQTEVEGTAADWKTRLKNIYSKVLLPLLVKLELILLAKGCSLF